MKEHVEMNNLSFLSYMYAESVGTQLDLTLKQAKWPLLDLRGVELNEFGEHVACAAQHCRFQHSQPLCEC